MYWKIARSVAKLTNVIFLVLVCVKISFIYENVFSDEKFSLLGRIEDSGSVYYYDNNNFPYFLNNNNEDFSILDLFDRNYLEKVNDVNESNLFRKIISHRLSLVYLFSIFFGDLVKIIYNMGVI